jgi:AcrR family transcriptional regulator
VIPPTARQPLSRERILRDAVALADADGIGGVTMRRLAEALGCEAMSLYHYVESKGALVTGLAEQVIGEVAAATAEDPPGATDWRELVLGRCLVARAVMLRHPWAPQVIMSLPEAPAITYAIYEQLVGTLVAAGFSYALAHRAIHALGSMIFGFTQELFEPPDGSAPTMTIEQMQAMAEAMPHLAALATLDIHREEGSLSTCDTQAEFEFTLALLLDGLDRARG